MSSWPPRSARRSMTSWTPAGPPLVAPMLGIVATPAAESFIGPLGVAYPQRVNLASVTTGMPTVSVPSGLGRGRLPTAVQLLGYRICTTTHLCRQ